MSAFMVTAHGGPKNVKSQKGESVRIGGILEDTMMNTPREAKMRNIAGLLQQTTGVPRGEPVMEGVLAKTTPATPAVPEFHKLPKGEVGKTKAKRLGQVPYNGPKY